MQGERIINTLFFSKICFNFVTIDFINHLLVIKWHTRFMKKISNQFTALMTCERGATTIEYTIIAALISVFAIYAMLEVQANMNKVFNKTSDAIVKSVK